MTQDITEAQWTQAKNHFDIIMDSYKELLGQPGVMVGPALMFTFEPLLHRYNSGERTQALYEEMVEVE